MNLRAKLLLIFIVGSLLPALLIGVSFYRNSTRAVEGMLRDDLEAQAARMAGEVEIDLQERERDLVQLAESGALKADAGRDPASAEKSASVPDDVRALLGGFITAERERYASVTFVGNTPESVPVRFEPPAPGGSAPRIKTGDFLSGQVGGDESVWATTEQRVVRSANLRLSTGTPGLVYTVPVFSADHAGGHPRGALIAELKLDALLQEAGQSLSRASNAAAAPLTAPAQAARLVVALDASGQIVYHTNDALKYQTSAAAMPYFAAVAREMQAGHNGTSVYHAPPDNARWLVAYQNVEGVRLSIAVAGSYTRAVAGLQRSALVGFGVSAVIALLCIILLYLILTRTVARIERVTGAAAAIASGNLNQRIETQANDETHALAESFNRMTDRLREHIAREAESKQFQSFVRLSAMLTHDLKNSIMGLSMLVTNMERQFHRAEFRADAISSIREATEKLGGIVARLSEPMKTLSGEYRITPQFHDLVPIIKRALAATAAPAAAFYEIRVELPETLVAPVDAERIERVVENLIVNAFEAMGGRGGRLTVLAGAESEHLVFFSVEDTGIGMSAEFIRTRLFHPFATTKKHGIGLGLYTCRESVEAHGGRLEVKSVQGSGTRFRVVLPSTPLQAATPARPTGKSVTEKTGTAETGDAG